MNILISLIFLCFCTSCTFESKEHFQIGKNPILPGYFADPSIIKEDDKYYIYTTIDPWGADSLACWVTSDFVNWEFNILNWPNTTDCHSNLSNENKVWAPSVVKKNDKYYMYVSVGSEVWCGIADTPLGPWRNILDNRPMIAYDESMYYHVIDAEVFVDDDEKSYLYWGSGWNWVNGHCMVAELNDDMCSFKTEVKEVTPANYFEAPFMIKENGLYYLTYSDGKTIEDTYKVRYAVSDNPFGPFIESLNSPILQTDEEKNIYGPGHHAISKINGENYIFYHKHSLPYKKGVAYRQLCINKFEFDGNNILEIKASDKTDLVVPKKNNNNSLIKSISCSSEFNNYYKSDNLLDNSFQTLWKPSEKDTIPYIDIELSEISNICSLELIVEYPNKEYDIEIEYSLDNLNWKNIDYCNSRKFPVNININNDVKFIKITGDKNLALWQISLN